MMNAGNLKGKTRQTSDWRRRMIAFVSALTLLISSCGLTAFAETDEDIYSDPVTAPIPSANTSPEPEEGEAQATPAPEGQPEEGTEPQEATGEGTETEGEPEVSEEPEDLTVYEPGTLTAEADGIGITVDYTAEARVPEGTVLTLTRAAGGDLYSALKSASKVLKTEEDATWKHELGEDAVFYTITLTNPEGNEVHPETGVTLTCTNLEIPADATGFVTGENAENLDWKDTLTVEFLPDAIGYAYLKQVQIGTVTLTHEDRDYMVTAAYGPDAGFPAETELKVREILPGTPEYALYSGMTDEALNEDWAEITLERYFDIAFVANGEELEPKADVDVQIVFRDKIEQNEETEVAAVHIENNEANVIEAETDSTKTAVHDDEAIDTVTFTSDSFSVYGVVQKKKITQKVLAADGNTYEINVTYGPEAEIPEGAELKVEEIPEGSDLWEAYRKQTAAALGADDVRLPGLYDITIIFEGQEIEPKAPISVAITLANAEAGNEELNVVHFKEEIPPELVDAAAEQTEVQPLAQEDQINAEHITDTTIDGQTVTFETDGFSIYAFAYTVVVYYKVATGETYRIKLDYDEDSGIPAGSVLKVDEILPEDARYAGYLEQAIKAATKTEDSEENNENTEEAELIIPDDQYARFFDIEIQSNGQKVEPTGKVSVTVELADAPEDRLDELKVVHFATEKTEVIDAQVSADNITFETESFSVYGVITEPETLPFDLNGRMFKIKNGSHYMSRETDYSSNPWAVKKTSDSGNAAMFTFEAGTEPGKYRIYTTWKDDTGEWHKFYIHINHNDGNPSTNASVNLTENGTMDLDVQRNNDGTYAIWRTIDGTRFYLNRHNGDGGPGFATYTERYNSNGLLTLEEVTTAHTNDGKDNFRMLIVKYADKYYIVNNDASLTEVEYNQHANRVIVENPMMWAVEQNGSNGHIYFNSKEAGFYGNQLASDWYRRYLDSNANTAWTEEDGTKNPNVTIQNVQHHTGYKDGREIPYDEVKITDRQNMLNSTALSIDQNPGQNTYRIHSNNNYIGIEVDSNGNPVRLIGQENDSNKAADILFATPFNIKNASYLKNSVNHIDISIKGTANVSVPLAKGNYYGPQGDKAAPIKTVVDNVKIDLKQEYLVDPDQIRITDEDMKRATLTAASMKTGESLDNVFYITGYSGNVDNGLSSAQVRIEGSFMVADLRDTQYETVDKYLYDNDPSYKKAVRDARLANKIEYTVTLVKPMTYYLKDNGTQLCDEDGKPITVTVEVAFSASFDYWSSKNECPPVHGVPYAAADSEADWKAGGIDSSDWSGMDFVLGGVTDDTQSPPYAIQITKIIQDTNGNRIKLKYPVTTYFKIYENKSDNVNKNGVAGLHVNQYGEADSRDANIHDNYSFWRNKKITVGEDGTATIFDLNADNAMYYIEELHDTESLPEYVTDVNGNIMEYVNTYIETEYVTRGDEYSTSSNDPMHVTDYFTRENENGYKSIPEVAGHFVGVDNVEHYERFLEFYVYNVYEPAKTTIKVKKNWPAGNIPSGAYLDVLLKRYKLIDKTAGSVPVVIPNDGGTPSGENPPTGETVKLTIKHGRYNQENFLDGFDGIDVPKNCTVTITVNGNMNTDWGVRWWCSDNPSDNYNNNYTRITPITSNSGVYTYTLVLTANTTIGVCTGTNDKYTVTVDYNPKLSSRINVGIRGTKSIFDLLISSANADEPTPVLMLDSNAATKPTLPTNIPQTKEWVLDSEWSQSVSLSAANTNNTWEFDQQVDVEDGSGNVYLYFIDSVQEYGFDSTNWTAQKDGQVTWGDHETNSDHSDNILSVTNTYTPPVLGSLTIGKLVTENGEEKNYSGTFYFGVYTVSNPTAATEKVCEGSVTLAEASSGTVTVSNLPYNTYYVFELRSEHGEPITDGIAVFNGTTFSVSNNHPEGVAVDANTGAIGTPDVTITNNEEGTGSLVVSKTITGEDADKTAKFNFTVTQTNEPKLNDTYGNMEFHNGVANFQLGNGENVTAINLPYGFTYTVAETEANLNGYATVYELSTSLDDQTEADNFIKTGETEINAFTNSKTENKSIRVKKEWLDIPYEDTINYPAVTFALYQTTTDNFGDAKIYEDNTSFNYGKIELNYGNHWMWNCPVELPEHDEQKHPYRYFVIETPKVEGGLNNTGEEILTDPVVPDGYKVYIDGYRSRNIIDVGDWSEKVHFQQPHKASVGNHGEILIQNTGLGYLQMDLKKKFLAYHADGSLWTETATEEKMKNLFIRVQIFRRAVPDTPGSGKDKETAHEGWAEYGNPIVIGYNGNLEPKHSSDNVFEVSYQGAWHWQILDSSQNQGLPSHGFVRDSNGNITVVKYQYVLKETGAFKDLDCKIPYNEYSWVAILPTVWQKDRARDSQIQKVELFTRVTAQDPDRLVNIPATDLSIIKEWDRETSVKEVYVKIYRLAGKDNWRSNKEDFTNILGTNSSVIDGFTNAKNSGTLSSTTVLKDVEGLGYVIALTPTTPAYISDILGAKSKDPEAPYYYWVEEVGYLDANDNIKRDVSVFEPVYSINGTTGATEINQDGGTKPECSTLLLGPMGTNEFKITNKTPDPEPGTLTITKQVSGYTPAATETYPVTVKKENKFVKATLVSDSQTEYEYSELTDTEYVYNITAGPEGQITITNLPVGTYTVQEKEISDNGYLLITSYEVGTTVTNNEATAQIIENQTTDVIVKNDYSLIDIRVKKIDNKTNNYLAGAKFQIVKVKDANGTLYEAGEEGSWTSAEMDINSEAGVVSEKLKKGFYKLIETQVPAGYLALTEDIIFEVGENDGTLIVTDRSQHNEMHAFNNVSNEFELTVKNQPGSPLPATGGSGTLIYTITGIFLITLAGTLLVARKRKANR